MKIRPAVWSLLRSYREAMRLGVELGIVRTISAAAKAAGIEVPITPHAARRGVATATLLGGASMTSRASMTPPQTISGSWPSRSPDPGLPQPEGRHLIAGWYLAATLIGLAIAIQLLGWMLTLPSAILEWRATRRNCGYWMRRRKSDHAYMGRVFEGTE